MTKNQSKVFRGVCVAINGGCTLLNTLNNAPYLAAFSLFVCIGVFLSWLDLYIGEGYE